MTAAVAPLPMPLQVADPSADARKRRREILASQRNAEATLKVIEPMIPMPIISEAATKRRKLNACEASKKSKKPQMKYDPDVPMTKEEAAVWRREQRRKRNRESAAASRQRQRDRIAELEVELDGWKDKFDSIMMKIKDLEDASGKSVDDYMSPEQSRVLLEVTTSTFVSPPTSPGHSGYMSEDAELSPVASSSLMNAVSVTPTDGLAKQIFGEVELEHSDKMISRQAVKIPDAPSLPLLHDSEDPVLPPETVLSAAPPSMVKLEPIDSSLFPVKEEKLPTLMAEGENEDDFGEFLLDAVQWL